MPKSTSQSKVSSAPAPELEAAAMVTEEQPVTPVKSAKDAINAMYAQDASSRLSNYLAASAKEIINASNKALSDSKSASNLHHSSLQRSMESSRPSASAILRMAKSERPAPVAPTVNSTDPLAKPMPKVVKRRPAPQPAPDAIPVVRTSLKLGPKKAPIVKSAKARPVSTKRPVTLRPTTSAPNFPKKGGLVQDVMRPSAPPSIAAAPATASATPTKPLKRSLHSIKQRFRSAPKDYAVTKSTSARAKRFAGFRNPNHPDPSFAEDFTPRGNAVDLYALSEPEAAASETAPKSSPASTKAKFGVVEDYHPNQSAPDQVLEGAPASNSATPNNNRYAIKGQSPFFLKSVSVEKRPLSDGPVKQRALNNPPAPELPTEQPKERRPKKNVYKKKTKPAKTSPKSRKQARSQSLPSRPTVIIPSSRRSSAPLIFLLFLTIILGAAVGATVYLCFFNN